MAIEMTKKKSIIIIAVVAAVIIAASLIFLMQSGGMDSLERQLDLAYKYLSEGRYEEALLAFDKVIEIDPKNIEARLGKIEAYIALGETEKAEEIRAEILELGVSEEELNEYTLEFERKLDEYKAQNDTREEDDSPEAFQTIHYEGEVATKQNVVALREDGIYVRNPDSSDYEKVHHGDFGAIVTNGAVAYFIDDTDCYIKELNLYTGAAENLLETKRDERDGTSRADILGCYAGCLYFEQDDVTDPLRWESNLHTFNLKTKQDVTHKLTNEYNDVYDFSIANITAMYHDEIYFTIHSGDTDSYLYKADLSDNTAEYVTSDGYNYTVYGNKLYYSEPNGYDRYYSPPEDWKSMHDLTKIKVMDLDTGNIKTITPKYDGLPYSIVFFENGFGAYDEDTDTLHYETYDGEVVEMDRKVLKWTNSEIIYA